MSVAGERAPALPPPRFDHLLALSDDVGVLEHARHTIPRRAHGYCLDDNARALLVCVRAGAPSPALAGLARRCLAFVADAQAPDGRCRNRLGYDRRWRDLPGSGDWWGRALWALGVTARRGGEAGMRRAAAELFACGVRQRSPWPRAMAYAALGAAELCAPGETAVADRQRASATLQRDATALLRDATALLARPPARDDWPWPEPRLTYANAVWPEALMAAGEALGEDRHVERGLELLAWLLETESRGGRLSPTPVGGWGPGEPRPGFDQQPIEASVLAEACARAARLTGEGRWYEGLARAAAWFAGGNDLGVPLADPATGGCCDGLTPRGPNRNQGAESTLALLATQQLQADAPARREAASVAAADPRSAGVHQR